MKYLIDNSTQLIHRASQAGDSCNFNTSPPKQRESTQDENYVNQLIKEKNYRKCDQCHCYCL